MDVVLCVLFQVSVSLQWTARERPQERVSNYSRRRRLSGRAADDAFGLLTRPLPPATRSLPSTPSP